MPRSQKRQIEERGCFASLAIFDVVSDMAPLTILCPG